MCWERWNERVKKESDAYIRWIPYIREEREGRNEWKEERKRMECHTDSITPPMKQFRTEWGPWWMIVFPSLLIPSSSRNITDVSSSDVIKRVPSSSSICSDSTLKTVLCVEYWNLMESARIWLTTGVESGLILVWAWSEKMVGGWEGVVAEWGRRGGGGGMGKFNGGWGIWWYPGGGTYTPKLRAFSLTSSLWKKEWRVIRLLGSLMRSWRMMSMRCELYMPDNTKRS